MAIERPDNLKSPVIKEAKLIDREGTIVFGDLKPGGATLVVEYDGMKAGDRVQAWGLASSGSYDETQVVPDRAISLTFEVPKQYFSGKRTVGFQYFLRGEDNSVIAISEAVRYLVTGSMPELLPAPVIQEAVDGAIIVSNLPIGGGTFLVDYPDAKAGDIITAMSMGPGGGNHVESKTFIGAVPVRFKVPKAWFEAVVADGGRSTVHSYSVSPVNGDPDTTSNMRMYRVE